jgi:formate dehydrogenase alpha subunit
MVDCDMERKPVLLTVNGCTLTATPGMSVLEAALASDIYIPHLCYDPDLKPHAGCRLCLVEIQGMRGLPAACTTLAAEGMIVTTASAELEQARRDTLELILAEHPMDCLTCLKNQKCELQKVVAYLGPASRQLRRVGQAEKIDESNPIFSLDPNYCIMCQKCVRTCDEIARAGILAVFYRGPRSKIGSLASPAEMTAACATCGECLKRCPVAALRPRVHPQ